CRTLQSLMPEIRVGVIVGDICTTNDADRLSVTGAKVTQINTDQFGGDCHLAAPLIDTAARGLGCEDLDLLIVENIGNLVCPAEFDIGENARVVVLSVTEGEDKPLKYPLMFQVSDAAILNKVDLLPYLDYDDVLAVDNMKKVHPGMPVFALSAKTGEGFDPWLAWLRQKVKEKTG
ncbi:MAG: hydrogenase nickel incorporation protein HypB, partial [Desulfotignum sp.]